MVQFYHSTLLIWRRHDYDHEIYFIMKATFTLEFFLCYPKLLEELNSKENDLKKFHRYKPHRCKGDCTFFRKRKKNLIKFIYFRTKIYTHTFEPEFYFRNIIDIQVNIKKCIQLFAKGPFHSSIICLSSLVSNQWKKWIWLNPGVSSTHIQNFTSSHIGTAFFVTSLLKRLLMTVSIKNVN